MIWWLVQNTVSAALLAIVVAAVCRIWRTRPALRHALWLVVLMKLVAPPLPLWSFAWPGYLPAWWPIDSTIQSATASPDREEKPFKPNPTPRRAEAVPIPNIHPELPGNPESFEVLGETAVAPLTMSAAPTTPRIGELTAWWRTLAWSDVERYALFGWVVIALGAAAWQLARWRKFSRLIDSAQFAPDWLEEEIREIARSLNVRMPKVLVLGVRCTPFVWVIGEVRLIWPESMLTGFTAESRRTIIAHELAHLARRDHWIARMEAVATVFWCWNPLFWYVRAKLHDAAEQACDARVTQLLPEARRAYAQALVEVCELLAQAVTPGPALGIGSQTRRAFERRLTMIMREKVTSRLSLGAVTGVGLLALAVLPGFVPAQNAATPPIPSGGPAPATAAADPFGAAALATPPALPAVPPTPATVDAVGPYRPAAVEAPTPPVPVAAPSVPSAPGFGALPAAVDTAGAYAPSAQAEPFGIAPTIAGMPGAMMGPPPATDTPSQFPSAIEQNLNGDPEEVVMLTRATYRLPRPLAESLAQFLNTTLADAVQAQVLDAYLPDGKAGMPPGPMGAPGMAASSGLPPAIDGTSARLVVTADAESQRVVGYFVGLLRAKGKISQDAGLGGPGGKMGMMGMSMDASYELPPTQPGLDALSLPAEEYKSPSPELPTE